MTRTAMLAIAAAVLTGLSGCSQIMDVCTAEFGLELHPGQDTIAVGETIAVRANGTTCGGEKKLPLDVTWSSSDTTVIRVDRNGAVTGRAAGTAYAIGSDSSEYSASGIEIRIDVIE